MKQKGIQLHEGVPELKQQQKMVSSPRRRLDFGQYNF